MSWRHTIRLGGAWKNDALTFEERRDEIVRRLRASAWVRDDVMGEIADVVDDLAAAPTAWMFDIAWDHIYDLADEDRVWIDLWSPVAVSS